MSNKKKLSLKKEVKFIDISVVGIFLFLIAFTVVMIIGSWLHCYEPSTLIMSVFGFCGLECGLLASLTKRKSKIKEEVEKLKQEDEKNNTYFNNPEEIEITGEKIDSNFNNYVCDDNSFIDEKNASYIDDYSCKYNFDDNISSQYTNDSNCFTFLTPIDFYSDDYT